MSASRDPEALLFDLGGVMLGIDFERAFRSWAACSALPADELRRRFAMDEPYERHERGEIGAAEYVEHLRTVLELDASDERIVEGWNAIFVGEIDESVEAVSRVSRRFPCYAFTNTNPTHQAYWTAAYPRVAGLFERVFISSELGLRKPERAAFEAIAAATGVAPGHTLFFDDSPENVAGAKAAGLRTVLVTGPHDVTERLARLDR